MGGVLEPLNMDNSKSDNRAASRPPGNQQRQRIDLPDEGEQLWPVYTGFYPNPKSRQRIPRRLPTFTNPGVLYVKKATPQILAEPEQRRARR
jgi:hypothetical protein